MTEEVPEINDWTTLTKSPHQLGGMISIVGFWGSDLDYRKGDAFNLNQKIYKRFYQFDDFQFVMVVEEGLENKVEEILAELQKGAATDLSKWKFVFGTKTEIETLFRGFKTDISLNEKQVLQLFLLLIALENFAVETTMKRWVRSTGTTPLRLQN